MGTITNNASSVAALDAAMHLGAIASSVYNTSSPEQVAHLFRNAANRVVYARHEFRQVRRESRQ